MSVDSRLTFSLIESSRRKGRDGAARAYRAVMKRDKPLGTDEVLQVRQNWRNAAEVCSGQRIDSVP